MPDDLPAPGQPAPRKRRSAKDELIALRREREEKAAEEARRRDPFRYAQNEIEKAVAEDAAESGYDDPWGWISDVCNHGCASGMVPGLVYYTNTCKFYETHKDAIWDTLHEDAENMGENILTMLGSLPWAGNVGSSDEFENCLAWYGYERAAQNLQDRKENGEPNDEEENEEGA